MFVCFLSFTFLQLERKQPKVKMFTIKPPNGKKYNAKMIKPKVFNYNQSNEIKDFFLINGYVVVDNVATQINMDNLVEKMQTLPSYANTKGFLDFYHDDCLAQLRQSIRLHKVFTTILQHHDLWVVFDRVIYQKANKHQDDLTPHVDQNPIRYPNFKEVQGMLALKDMNETTGTLALIPKSHLFFHSKYSKWINSTKENYVEYQDDDLELFHGLNLKKGQFVIWDSRTTHSRVRGTKKLSNRYAALISFCIADQWDTKLVSERIQAYKSGTGHNNHDAGLRATSQPRCNVSFRTKKEILTPHGKKIYGIEHEDISDFSCIMTTFLLLFLFIIGITHIANLQL